MIKVLEPCITEQDVKAVSDGLKMGWVSHHGPEYVRFAHDLEDYLGLAQLNKRIVLTSSGSAALHIAYVLSGVRNAEYVAIPDITFAATLNALFQETNKIVLCDITSSDWNMNWQYLKDKDISHIITVDLLGTPFEFSDNFEQYVKSKNIVVIEDAAESLGSKDARGRFCGTRGDYGVFSFFANKIITTGEGGALVVPDWQYEEAYNLVSHYPGGKEYDHAKAGYNYRMTHMSAALGRSQLKKIEFFLQYKTTIRKSYEIGINPPAYPQAHVLGAKPNFWLNAFTFPNKHKRDDAMRALDLNLIDYRYIFKPMSSLPFTKHLQTVGQGNAISLFQRTICLPSSISLTKEHINLICKVVNDAQ
jgi:perosamine synthetase